MANNLILIDFFGLPGCGKSVISHELACLFALQGTKVRELSYSMDHHNVHIIRLVKKMFYTLFYAFFYPTLFIRLVKVVKHNRSLTNTFSQVRNLCYKLFLLHKANTIVILDEGIAQSSLSIAFGTEDDVIAIYKKLLCFVPRRFDLVTVYLDVSVETALDNMAKRPTNDSRIEKATDAHNRKEQIKAFMDKTNEMSQIADISIKIRDEEGVKDVTRRVKEQLESIQFK